MNFTDRHIELVELVNNSKTQVEHDLASSRLRGFREGVDLALGRQIWWHMVDLHYIKRGIERPMCCGEFLDWQPPSPQEQP